VVILIGSYGWPEYYDRIHIHGEDKAIAARALMDARPGTDEVVWSHQGNAVWLPGTGRAMPGPVGDAAVTP